MELFRVINRLTIFLALWGYVFGLANFAEMQNPLIDETRNIYSSFDSEDQIEQGIPSTPMDLLEKLRKVGAMEDATLPSDAIDDALRFFDQNVPDE